MKIELDVHTHTIASGHAFSTLQEMAQAAAGKGLKVLGITEHSPGIPGTCHPIYFRNLHVVPRRMYGVELLLGAEINILDGKGNLDLDEDYMKMLDIRIAGIHSLCYEYGTIEENTHGMVQAISISSSRQKCIAAHKRGSSSTIRIESICSRPFPHKVFPFSAARTALHPTAPTEQTRSYTGPCGCAAPAGRRRAQKSAGGR